MKLLGNLVWLLCGGLAVSIEYMVASIGMMLTIVGIPFGIQSVKLGILALWPFGTEVRDTQSSGSCLSLALNIVWIIIGGFWIWLTHIFFGILLCITIIGMPFGKQHFKMAGLALMPFGKEIV